MLIIVSDYFTWEELVTFGDLLTLLALIFGMCQFTKQMNETRRNNKKAQKENWYLNIIVLPQLNNINENYNQITKDTLFHKKELNNFMSKISTIEFKIKQAKIKSEIKKKISHDFEHIISLVRSYNTDLANEANNTILELQDLCTKIIDQYDVIEEAQHRSSLLNNKEIFISILNKGLNADEIKKQKRRCCLENIMNCKR